MYGDLKSGKDVEMVMASNLILRLTIKLIQENQPRVRSHVIKNYSIDIVHSDISIVDAAVSIILKISV